MTPEEQLKQVGLTQEMWLRLLEAIAEDVEKMSDAEIEEMMQRSVAEECARIRQIEAKVKETLKKYEEGKDS